MTRTFSDGHPKVLPACNFLSQYYFYNIFLQKSCRFSLQTLTKFEAAKTGSGVGFLRLTAVCLKLHARAQATHAITKMHASAESVLRRLERVFRCYIVCETKEDYKEGCLMV